MIDLPAIRTAYLAEVDTYRRLGQWVQERLDNGLADADVLYPEVTSRPKEPASFLKKAIRGSYSDPLTEITDKAGVRVLVALIDDVSKVEEVVEQQFEVLEHQDKGDLLAPDQLGYLGVHFLVTPRGEDLPVGHELAGRICEIQVHTRAQNAWSTVNHPLVYKPGKAPAIKVQRQIMRLVALVELFDSEIASARKAIMNDPDYRQSSMLLTLERPFFHLARQDYDAQLSLMILDAIQHAYNDAELDDFPNIIQTFLEQHRDRLEQILEHAHPEVSPLLFQPEAIAVMERLENHKAQLRAAWDAQLHHKLLDDLSADLGRPA